MSRGVLLMIIASLCFTLMVACVKAARAELDAMSIIAWRGLVAVPLTALMVRSVSLKVKRPGLLFARCAIGMTAMFGFYSAALGLPLTDLSFVHRLQPILLAVLAPLILGANEKVGGAVWVVLAVGIIGCGILLGPELAIGNEFGWYALLGTTASATAHLCVRALGKTEHPISVALWFQVFVLIVSFAIVVSRGGSVFSVPDGAVLLYLIGTGIFSASGQMLMTTAYKIEKAAVVGAATYLGPVFGVALDVIAFGIVPGWDAFLGGAVIVGASVYLLRATKPAPDAEQSGTGASLKA